MITAKYIIGDVNAFELGTRYLDMMLSCRRYKIRRQFLLYVKSLRLIWSSFSIEKEANPHLSAFEICGLRFEALSESSLVESKVNFLKFTRHCCLSGVKGTSQNII